MLVIDFERLVECFMSSRDLSRESTSLKPGLTFPLCRITTSDELVLCYAQVLLGANPLLIDVKC